MAMRRFGLFFLLIFIGSAEGGRQLPPEILMDQLLLRAERLIEAEDSEGALEVIQQILALQVEHGLELPPAFHFSQAQTEFNTGSLLGAKEAVTRYLTTAGRDGELYADALEFLEEVDRILERRGVPECTEQPEDSECWMEVANQPECYVWNPDLQPEETATWMGGCAAGLVQGDGALTWKWPPDNSSESEGPYRFGKRHGHWFENFASGNVAEGPYVDGERNGDWIWKYPDGQVESGPYVDGKQNGHWVERLASGTVQEGPYVDGQEHGQWVVRLSDGGFQEGPFAAGARTGHWVLTFADGQIEEGPMLDGKRHGPWVLREPGPDGRICEIRFRDGEAVGEWDCRSRDGNR